MSYHNGLGHVWSWIDCRWIWRPMSLAAYGKLGAVSTAAVLACVGIPLIYGPTPLLPPSVAVMPAPPSAGWSGPPSMPWRPLVGGPVGPDGQEVGQVPIRGYGPSIINGPEVPTTSPAPIRPVFIDVPVLPPGGVPPVDMPSGLPESAPEPWSVAILAVGLVGLAWRKRH